MLERPPLRDPYSRLVRTYRVLEWLAFGNLLHRARTAHLECIGAQDRVLVVGDGDGRFGRELRRLRRNIEGAAGAAAAVISLDRSLAMLRSADSDATVCSDALWPPLSDASFDVVVTQFVLDQWQDEELERVVGQLSALLRPGGQWLYCDFAVPTAGPGRWWARLWLPILYIFFRAVAEIEARRWEDPTPLLESAGLTRVSRRSLRGGFVTAEVWRKRSRATRGLPPS